MRTTVNNIPLIELPEVGSTNVEAMRLGLAGAATPLWVRADRQTAGRGRSGRPWESQAGNLFASLLVRTMCPPAMIHQLSFVAAVAVVAAIRRIGRLDLEVRLKWPNDVLLRQAKLVGILAESTVQGDRGAMAVIGIGVNLAHAPEGLGRATTCLANEGLIISPGDMLDAVATEVAAAQALWAEGTGFAAIRALWLADATPIGTAMTVHAGSHMASGTFAGMDHDGALILRDQTGYDRSLTFGDVTLDTAHKAASIADRV